MAFAESDQKTGLKKGTLKSGEFMNKYSEILESYRIIFTKMDETQGLGNILNVKVLTDKPCSYITFGQDVPEDIEQMNPEKIAKFLLGSFEN